MKLPCYRLTQLEENFISVECSNAPAQGFINEHILEHLVQSARVEKGIPRVVWNLAEFVKMLEAVLPKDAASALRGMGGQRRADWYDGDTHYRLFYQPGKFLGIHAGGYGDEVTFYGLDQFFPEPRTIESVADVQAAADELRAAFSLIGIEHIDNLKSPVAVVEASGLLDKVYKQLPDPANIPAECKAYALESDTWGPWQSAYQVGYWPQAYSYDMASCYPSIAARLPYLEAATYKQSKKMLGAANMAFLKGTLHINPEHPLAWCSPIVAPVGDVIANPVGTIKGTFTLGQVKYVEKSGMGEFKLTDGWFVFLRSDFRPFARVMTQLYAQRSINHLVSQVAKRVIDGIIGRLAEYHDDKPTQYTNPLYHSIIRNSASLKVGKFLFLNSITRQELIHVNTDGFHATRWLGLPDKVGMGQWRSEPPEPLLVLSPAKIASGDSTMPILEALQVDKKRISYAIGSDEINLLALSAEQNRHFPKFPRSGGEVLKQVYSSEPFEVGEK